MGVGSQRAAIENPNLVESFNIRPFAPDILLFANLGAVQLNYGYSVDECRQAVEMIQADALILHLNALQEAVQPEGLPRGVQPCARCNDDAGRRRCDLYARVSAGNGAAR